MEARPTVTSRERQLSCLGVLHASPRTRTPRTPPDRSSAPPPSTSTCTAAAWIDREVDTWIVGYHALHDSHATRSRDAGSLITQT
eukprot:scaffold31532_cov58-Phaeocystis_antarctica.AAC.2